VGIYDRDWYRDKKKQDEAKNSLYDPKETLNNSLHPRKLRGIVEASQQAGLLFDQCSAF